MTMTMLIGNGKADALVRSAGAGDRRVQADHFAAQVEQRPAAVARIDRRVGLQEVLILHAVVAQPQIAAAFGADDAVGDGVAQAEGTAHGQHEIADLQLAGIAEPRRHEPSVLMAMIATSVAGSAQVCLGCKTRPSASLMLMPVSVEYLMTWRLVST